MILLEGKPIKERIDSETLSIVHNLRKINFVPHLAVIMVGERDDSKLYVSIKSKEAKELGMDFSLYRFSEIESQQEIIDTINHLNNDKEIHGIIVQLPLPEQFDSEKIIETIGNNKDVDNLKGVEKFQSPTPNAVMDLFEQYDIQTEDKKIVILGKGRLVGQPLEAIMKRQGWNVESCDIETKDLLRKVKEADIVVAATGTPNIITEDIVKKNSVIISLGREANFDRLKDIVEAITPKIGGVGPITVARLLNNTAKAAQELARY